MKKGIWIKIPTLPLFTRIVYDGFPQRSKKFSFYDTNNLKRNVNFLSRLLLFLWPLQTVRFSYSTSHQKKKKKTLYGLLVLIVSAYIQTIFQDSIVRLCLINVFGKLHFYCPERLMSSFNHPAGNFQDSPLSKNRSRGTKRHLFRAYKQIFVWYSPKKNTHKMFGLRCNLNRCNGLKVI